MKEKPILMCGDMVRAILAGHKIQTRRVIKPQPFNPTPTKDDGIWSDTLPRECVTRYFGCPYGQPGDRLWVRETWKKVCSKRGSVGVSFRADDSMRAAIFNEDDVLVKLGRELLPKQGAHWSPPWYPSIFMPRGACRITLGIVAVRIERVQDITESGAEAEGCEAVHCDMGVVSAREHYESLWNELNGKRGFGWDTNPFVWVIKFRKILT